MLFVHYQETWLSLHIKLLFYQLSAFPWNKIKVYILFHIWWTNIYKYQEGEKGSDLINQFISATLLCLFQTRTWISNTICLGLFCVQWFKVGGDCSFCWCWWNCLNFLFLMFSIWILFFSQDNIKNIQWSIWMFFYWKKTDNVSYATSSRNIKKCIHSWQKPINNKSIKTSHFVQKLLEIFVYYFATIFRFVV